MKDTMRHTQNKHFFRNLLLVGWKIKQLSIEVGKRQFLTPAKISFELI